MINEEIVDIGMRSIVTQMNKWIELEKTEIEVINKKLDIIEKQIALMSSLMFREELKTEVEK